MKNAVINTIVKAIVLIAVILFMCVGAQAQNKATILSRDSSLKYISVPVYVDDIQDYIGNIDLTIEFDSAKLKLSSLEYPMYDKDSNLLAPVELAHGFSYPDTTNSISYNLLGGNQIEIDIENNFVDYSRGLSLLYLNFTVVGAQGETADIKFIEYKVNGQDHLSKTTDGYIGINTFSLQHPSGHDGYTTGIIQFENGDTLRDGQIILKRLGNSSNPPYNNTSFATPIIKAFSCHLSKGNYDFSLYIDECDKVVEGKGVNYFVNYVSKQVDFLSVPNYCEDDGKNKVSIVSRDSTLKYISVPIFVEDIQDYIGNIDLAIEFDSAKLKLSSLDYPQYDRDTNLIPPVELAQGFRYPDSTNTISYNLIGGNQIEIDIENNFVDYSRGLSLVYLNFTIVGAEGEAADIKFIEYKVNGQDLLNKTTDGSIKINTYTFDHGGSFTFGNINYVGGDSIYEGYVIIRELDFVSNQQFGTPTYGMFFMKGMYDAHLAKRNYDFSLYIEECDRIVEGKGVNIFAYDDSMQVDFVDVPEYCEDTNCSSFSATITPSAISAYGVGDGKINITATDSISEYTIIRHGSMVHNADTTTVMVSPTSIETEINSLVASDYTVIVKSKNACESTEDVTVLGGFELNLYAINKETGYPVFWAQGYINKVGVWSLPRIGYSDIDGLFKTEISIKDLPGDFDLYFHPAYYCSEGGRDTINITGTGEATDTLFVCLDCSNFKPVITSSIDNYGKGEITVITDTSMYPPERHWYGMARYYLDGNVVKFSTTENTVIISDLSLGEHSLTIVDANGCYVTEEIIISESTICGNITSNIIWTDTVKIGCDITIDPNVTLTIASGTYVEFQGNYMLKVEGQLLAEGTKYDMIIFTAEDSAKNWKGIRFFDNASTDTSVIKYCRIEKAQNVEGSSMYEISGGGIFVANFDKLEISYNIITDNSCGNMVAPGIGVNAGNGAGIYCNNSSPKIINNKITNNFCVAFGGGIACENNSSPLIYGNIIANNMATGSTLIPMSIFAEGGGGVFCSSSNPTLYNNTIVNNQGVGVVVMDYAMPEFYNNILYGNGRTYIVGACQVFVYNPPFNHPNFIHNNLQGGFIDLLTDTVYVGIYSNNIDADPLFINPTAAAGLGYNGLSADWSLRAHSPCINAGDTITDITNFPKDIAGNDRIINEVIDIGAYESRDGIYYAKDTTICKGDTIYLGQHCFMCPDNSTSWTGDSLIYNPLVSGPVYANPADTAVYSMTHTSVTGITYVTYYTVNVKECEETFSFSGLVKTNGTLSKEGKVELYIFNEKGGSAYYTTNINQYGAYSFDSITKGKYKILATVDNFAPTYWGNTPEFDEASVFYLYKNFISVDINVTETVGLSETSAVLDLKVYPNPVRDILNISLGLIADTDVNLEIINIYGQTVFSNTIQTENSLIQLDVSDYAQGIYFGKLTTANGKTVLFKYIK